MNHRENEQKQIEEMRQLAYNKMAPGSVSTQQMGVPKVTWGTQAVYSTLPANAVNLNWTQEATAEAATVIREEIFSRVVPNGRVIYIRGIRVNITDAENVESEVVTPLGIPNDIFSITVQRQKLADTFNQDIQLEPLDGFHPLFMWAGPGDIVSVLVDFNFSFVSPPPTAVNFITHLHGDVLIPNEAPVPYTAYAGGPQT